MRKSKTDFVQLDYNKFYLIVNGEVQNKNKLNSRRNM